MIRAREQEVLSREDVPTVERVWAAFLYHSELSYRKVGLALGHSHEAIHQWYHQIAELFDPEPDRYGVTAVDETNIAVEEDRMPVQAAQRAGGDIDIRDVPVEELISD